MKLAVFDCDGTLVDGQADICETMEQAFAASGHQPPARSRIRRIVGLSLPVAVRHLAPDLGDAEAQAVVESYKSGYLARRQQGLLHEPLYDGIGDLLRTLHSGGWTLAVATGKSQRGLTSLLASHGLTDLFTSLQTADFHPSKPHPAMLEAALFEAGAEPAQAVMIGDTSFDMHMARAAQVRAIGVGWGYHPADELRASGAAEVADTAAELHEALERAL